VVDDMRVSGCETVTGICFNVVHDSDGLISLIWQKFGAWWWGIELLG
jgi:hypothetical protein